MSGDNLTLTNTARVGGNQSAHVRQLKNVRIADGATIGGPRDIQVRVRQRGFARPRFYFRTGWEVTVRRAFLCNEKAAEPIPPPW